MKRKILFLPDNKSAMVPVGTSVLIAAQRAGVRLNQRCAGKAACLTCKIKVSDEEAAGLSAPNQKELLKLAHLVDEGTRLACQTKIMQNVVVNVPEDPLKAFIRAQLEGKQDE
jgi:2Fe-2S ferredoxin